MPGTEPCCFRNATTRGHFSACVSFHNPVQPGVMRPSGATAVASATISPAPPMAWDPRWIRCQSLMTPSSAEYWHIGDTAMRFLSVMDLSVNLSNKVVM